MPDGSAQYDVVIVGFGPTGATLANLLALRDIRVLVLDREADQYHLPRAVHFDDETMRVFQTAGIADQLTPLTHINPGMRFVDEAGALLLDWPRPQEKTAQGWHASYRLHQPDLERLLREQLATRPTADVLTCHEAVALNRSSEQVTITARDRSSGQTGQISSQFVVGCDGARSFIRGQIGGGMDDLGFQERWLVIDVLLKRPRPDLGDHSIQFCSSDRPMTYCRSPGIRRRWEITLLPEESDAEMTDPARVWSLLSRWITSEDAELERSAVYTFKSALAHHWQENRVLIAGDAAHLTPPFMGQGMCTGIRDAANLAWKLADVIAGDAGDALLDSYQQEREPHARQYIETAMRLGGLINSLGREDALQMAQGQSTMKSIQPRLGCSQALCQENDPQERVGRLFAQPVLADGMLLDDWAGYHPVLIHLPGFAEVETSNMRSLNAADHAELGIALAELGAQAVLVGADRYVRRIWAARNSPTPQVSA